MVETEQQVEYLRQRWKTRMRVSLMAKELGLPENLIRRIAVRHNLGARPHRESQYPAPSRSEIKKRAAGVRATWSPEEKERRFVGPRKRKAWSVPMIRMSEFEAPSFSRAW